MKILIFTILATILIFIQTGCSQKQIIKPAKSELENSLELAGKWFLANQNDNFLYYEYFPFTDQHSLENNQIRELASLWSISRLANHTGDTKYQDLTQKGLNYFERSIYYDSQNNYYYLKFGEKDIDIASSAFLLLTYLETNSVDRDEIISGLANGILFQQNPDGSFRPYFYSNRDSNKDFFPGEAMLSIISLYQKNPEQKYLSAIQNAYLYYKNYWSNNRNTAFIPWHSRTYAKLFAETDQTETANFIFEMNDYLLENYQSRDNCQTFIFDKGSVTAVHLEGVIQAYQLAIDFNDQSRQKCYQEFIEQGFGYMTTLQVQSSDSLPSAALGGIWDGPAHNSMRVDRNQHYVMALMDYLNIDK